MGPVLLALRSFCRGCGSQGRITERGWQPGVILGVLGECVEPGTGFRMSGEGAVGTHKGLGAGSR